MCHGRNHPQKKVDQVKSAYPGVSEWIYVDPDPKVDSDYKLSFKDPNLSLKIGTDYDVVISVYCPAAGSMDNLESLFNSCRSLLKTEGIYAMTGDMFINRGMTKDQVESFVFSYGFLELREACDDTFRIFKAVGSYYPNNGDKDYYPYEYKGYQLVIAPLLNSDVERYLVNKSLDHNYFMLGSTVEMDLEYRNYTPLIFTDAQEIIDSKFDAVYVNQNSPLIPLLEGKVNLMIVPL